MSRAMDDWEVPESKSTQKSNQSQASQRLADLISTQGSTTPEQASGEPDIWFNPELSDRDATANLDSQDPPTLYYLGRLVDIPEVVSVYVEQRRDGGRKHWAVLEERHFETMEEIYEIEEDTLDRFPMADLNFRVTIDTGDGPSVSEHAVKIYDAL